TLHRWLTDGKLTDHRTVGGHRRYESAEVEALLSVSDGMMVTEKDVAIYARVSTQKQAETLTRQHERLVEACRERGDRIVLDCSEIASGLNDHRRQFFKIIEAACQGKVKRVVVEHRDRLTQFGFRTLEQFFKGAAARLKSLNKPTRQTSYRSSHA
ncbi:MAG: IS607 family transposase, partial [Candidatus Tectomicrobia bacterium]|nr:IS607 family transposase [Candidatus Tectomicrobia bacterium]